MLDLRFFLIFFVNRATGFQNLHSGKKSLVFHGRFVYVDKTLTDLQILGCELHQNTFGGRALP